MYSTEYQNQQARKFAKVGVGRVNLLPLGSGFGLFDFARVGFWFFGYFLGSPSGQRNLGSGYARFKILCNLQSILAGSGKKIPKFRQRCKKLAIFLKNLLLRVYSGFAKFTTG